MCGQPTSTECIRNPTLGLCNRPPLLNRVGYIDTVRGPSICVVDLRGLLKGAPEHSAWDKGSEYCIDGFAIDRYSNLLTQRQHMFPDICTRTTFVKTHQLVSN